MLVLIRGAGDLASGIALRLTHCGCKCILTDQKEPTSIRRTVSFSEAIRLGKCNVEDLQGEYAENYDSALRILERGKVPVLADPELTCLKKIKPDVLVDAILAKRNLGTKPDMAPIVIGVGPGFSAGKDCHAVVETMRGHSLGRVIYKGEAIPNTNIPGLIGGYAGERVLRAPKNGILHLIRDIASPVTAGEILGEVDGVAMKATISGVLRGILPEGSKVTEGMKAGDVDPRGNVEACYSCSDKALAVAGGVLEAILTLSR